MSSEPTPIRFEGVSKRFTTTRGAPVSLKGMLFGRRSERREFWAIRDVTFDVDPGTSVGLIGGNGAGKSTLLRLAAGLSQVTEGRIGVPADMQSVLSLGGNFDGTLTGRENAMTAMIVNGMDRGEAADRLGAVIGFSELEDFIDTPVRTYSAGMTLRLAFGVAAQFRASAFLVDEVLSVGDLRFQSRCIEHLTGLRESGATILMASHDLGQTAELCDEIVWMQGGRVRMKGPSDEVVEAYQDAMRSDTFDITPAAAERPAGPAGLELRRNRFGSQELTLADVRVNGGTRARIASGEPLAVSALVTAAPEPRRAIVGITIRRADDGLEVLNEHVELGRVTADQAVQLEIDRLDLSGGHYMLDIGVYEVDWRYAYDYHWGAYELEVDGSMSGGAPLRPPLRWASEAAAPSGSPASPSE